MKKFLTLLSTMVVLSCGGNHTDPSPDPTPQPDPPTPVTPAIETPSFALGADISWASEMEAGGRKFQKADGTQAELLEVLKSCGVNAIRLRVWVNPYKGWSGKADVLAVAKKVKEAGLALMVDFHYSDFFADPKRQLVPSDWSADKNDINKLVTRVAGHTREVLQALKDAGVSVNWVQIGNETRGGMIFPAGALNYNNKGSEFAGYVKLSNAGYSVAKEVFPSALVMFHLNNAYDTDNNNWWVSNFKAQGGKFDAIALSHYPQAESAMTASQYNAKAIANIKSLYNTCKVPVLVAEVGVKQKQSDAASVLSAFMSEARKTEGCKGVFYWEPEVDGSWKPELYDNVTQLRKYSGDSSTGAWIPYDQGAFTTAGQPSDVFLAFVR